MLAAVSSFGLSGIDAYPVTVEADLSRGLPAFEIVGLPDAAVKEARDRVRAAMKNTGLEFPTARIVLNLAPADRKKSGAAYDLAILLAILKASGALGADMSGFGILGELSLGGELRPRRAYCRWCWGPVRSACGRSSSPLTTLPRGRSPRTWRFTRQKRSARCSSTCAAGNGFPVAAPSPPSRLRCLRSPTTPTSKARRRPNAPSPSLPPECTTFCWLGPPGSGKSMLARRLPSILPPPGYAEQVETTKLHSVAGLLPRGVGLMAQRPFRSPHHSISAAGWRAAAYRPAPERFRWPTMGCCFSMSCRNFPAR